VATSDSAANSRVIGYFALDGDRLLVENGACVVTGTQSQMLALIQRLPANRRSTAAGESLDFRPRKIRFGAIIEGMAGGGAYAFDSESYAQFRPLANDHGFDLAEFDTALPEVHAEISTADRVEQEHEQQIPGVALLTVRLDR